MANYCAALRSSYFEVVDAEKLTDWFDLWPTELEVWKDSEGRFAFGGYDSVPYERGEAGDDELLHGFVTDHDFVNELAEHVADGWAVIIVETGAEKLRYVGGHATVVFSDGRVEFKDLISWAEEQIGNAHSFTQPCY